MRLRKPSGTWGWAEAVAASGETEAGLRRKLQRGVVQLPTTPTGRTEVHLDEIAALRVSRHLCDTGFNSERAFSLAKWAIGKLFTDPDTDQNLFYMIGVRTPVGTTEPRWLRVNPENPDDLRELTLQLSVPNNVVVPVQWLVRDAWYALPQLPDDIAKWLRSLSATLDRLERK